MSTDAQVEAATDEWMRRRDIADPHERMRAALAAAQAKDAPSKIVVEDENALTASEAAFVLRKWADVLDVPSGPFVNQDLRMAADRLDALAAAQAGAPDWQQLEEWIVMADNRLEVADCPGCVDVARSYLQKALTTIRSLRPPAAQAGTTEIERIEALRKKVLVRYYAVEERSQARVELGIVLDLIAAISALRPLAPAAPPPSASDPAGAPRDAQKVLNLHHALTRAAADLRRILRDTNSSEYEAAERAEKALYENRPIDL